MQLRGGFPGLISAKLERAGRAVLKYQFTVQEQHFAACVLSLLRDLGANGWRTKVSSPRGDHTLTA